MNKANLFRIRSICLLNLIKIGQGLLPNSLQWKLLKLMIMDKELCHLKNLLNMRLYRKNSKKFKNQWVFNQFMIFCISIFITMKAYYILQIFWDYKENFQMHSNFCKDVFLLLNTHSVMIFSRLFLKTYKNFLRKTNLNSSSHKFNLIFRMGAKT